MDNLLGVRYHGHDQIVGMGGIYLAVLDADIQQELFIIITTHQDCILLNTIGVCDALADAH